MSHLASARYATGEETASALTGWGRDRGLSYERVGMLPTASTLLEPGESPAHQTARVHEQLERVPALDLPKNIAAQMDDRAHWAENLCTGRLPGGIDGTLAHYCAWYLESGDYAGWRIDQHTVVVAPLLDGIRVAHDMEGRAEWPTVIGAYEREYGRDHKLVDAGAMRWRIPAEEDEQLVRTAIANVPAGAHITLRDGMIVASIEDAQGDPAKLDQLCRTASAFASGLSNAARSLRPLTPGDPLPEPRATPYRDWLRAGADRVAWPAPPPDLDAAVAAYGATAQADPQVGKRRRRGRLLLLALFAFIGAVIAPAGAVFGGVAAAAAVFGTVMLMGLVVALFMARGAGRHESGFRQQAFGLEAFAREYANSRGLYMEDQDELRRRIPVPVHGSPQRVMRGALPGGADGRVVLWRDRNLPGRGFVNMAIVHAPDPPAAEPPYVATPADGGWLVVCEWTDQRGRSAARLDAVAREASRLAAAAPLHR